MVTKLKQIKGLPSNFEWLKERREFLKSSPVKKQRFARPSQKERIFYLFSDILIYCTTNGYYKGHFECSLLRLRNVSEQSTQFQLIYLPDTDKIRYTITAESNVEKQDWLQQFHRS